MHVLLQTKEITMLQEKFSKEVKLVLLFSVSDRAIGLSLSLTRPQLRPPGSVETQVKHTHTHECRDRAVLTVSWFTSPQHFSMPPAGFLQCHFSPTWTVKSFNKKKEKKTLQQKKKHFLLVWLKKWQVSGEKNYDCVTSWFILCSGIPTAESWPQIGMQVDWSSQEQ